MSATVFLECARCLHRLPPESNAAFCPLDGSPLIAAWDTDAPGPPPPELATVAETLRQRRLKALPASLPVGGIITPV